jgi:RNA polymerase sigma-70 factor (ECF subfamily)
VTAVGDKDVTVIGALSDETVAAACRGEISAVNAVYRALSPRVLSYLIAKGASDPEGLTSEVFLSVLPKLSRFSGGAGGLRTFVFSVAHARMVDDLRTRRRQPDTVSYEPQLDGRLARSAEQQALDNADQERARTMLALLPSDQAEVLSLRVLADLSLEQVAEVMGRSVGAVKQLQRRGLLALRGQLAEQGVTR